ncbi:hypothetical protein TrispH2_010859 [Trichoplax sp. H2]|uniref:Uncharacterized protein n=1 Tax=Trichoplax adhaerens TaxID=10228 RepID=B3SBB4_TRIAD|nr:predicted protein [Trichoplax adhaerens]EDV19975.1 predicted protein [Trichoplax adhaerens]RDD37780.1 hypothetical protein TrispH2_010859 [Trichoplax sp. H2]|eukprot:XP_002117565.1 predicted protein [Trichoplax adhaerens]
MNKFHGALLILSSFQLISYTLASEFPAGGIDLSITVQLNVPKINFIKISSNATLNDGKVIFDGFPIKPNHVAALHSNKDVVVNPNSGYYTIRSVKTEVRVLLRVLKCVNGINDVYIIEEEVSKLDNRPVKQLKVAVIKILTECDGKFVGYLTDYCNHLESAIHRRNHSDDEHHHLSVEEQSSTELPQ